ncbi:MAG TPA: hypothetical protein PK500_04850 [Candidatus Egerieousia sp.]|nr:hypothetical protein [Candidatus Egerieousia sp.]HPT05963.1 hypothetical protein [Candidatus Egerieousia sp.]
MKIKNAALLTFTLLFPILSFAQIQLGTTDTTEAKKVAEDFCIEEKISSPVRDSLVSCVVARCVLLKRRVETTGTGSGAGLTFGGIQMYQRMQNEFDEKVLKILGKKGYNKFADYTFDYKQEKFQRLKAAALAKRKQAARN